FKHTFFIDASSQSTIRSDLRGAIRSIDGHQQDTDEDALSFLSSQPDSLLIFDNADDPNLELVSFFPKFYRGIILVTSRVRSLGELATLHHLELGPMSNEEAVQTLAKASRRTLPVSGQDEQYMKELVEELGCLALALVQAGVYIYNMGPVQAGDTQSSSFKHYLSLFRRERGNLMRQAGAPSLDQYKHSVYSTLDLSYSLLSPIAREFVGICSKLHYSNISLSMILTATERDFEDQKSYAPRPESHVKVKERLRFLFKPHGSLDESHIRETIRSLVSLSLVQVTMAKDTILLRYHPLVHAWANEKTAPEVVSLHFRMAITVLSTSLKSIPPAHLQYLLPHIVSIVERAPLNEFHLTDLTILGWFMGENSMTKPSLELLEEAAKRLKEEAVPFPSGTAIIYSSLAITYAQSGKMNEAEDLLLQALETESSLLSNDHLDTTKLNWALGGVYLYMGRYKESENLLTKVVEEFRRHLGDSHEDTVEAWTTLSATYMEIGKQKEALEIDRKLYAIQKDRLGERAPETILALNNLAVGYLQFGELEEASNLLEKIVEIVRDLHGEKHLHVVGAYNNLARAYEDLGKWEEAEELQVKAVTIMEELVGWEHTETLAMASSLISFYIDLGKLEEAKGLQNK
ncbi:TPR-like protein, partial [Serendipita vermifera]